MNGRTILVLGGGIGGIVTAQELRKKLSGKHRIVLIDKTKQHVFAPSLLWLMMGWRYPSSISRDLITLSRKGIEFVRDEIQGIDLHAQTVRTTAQTFQYDYLVISLGAELVPDAIPNFSRHAHTFYDLDGAIQAKHELERFDSGNLAIVISSTPFKCPAAPYEAAFLLDYAFRKKGTRNKVNLQVFTPEPLPMPVAGPELGNTVKKMLEEREISYHPQTKLISVEPDSKRLVFDKGDTVPFDFLLAIPPHRSPTVVQDAGLTNNTDWIPVHKETMRTEHSNVFAIGDVTGVTLTSGMMLPKAGVFAERQAKAVARTVADEISNRGMDGRFTGEGECFVELGYGSAAYASGNFYADPKPVVNLKQPGKWHHWGKIWFEKYWLWKWF